MKRTQLDDIAIFIAVAKTEGFRSAAIELKISPGSVSEAIKRLEDNLGARLFERTTRRMAITTAGKYLYHQCSPALVDIHEAIQELSELQNGISGKLRLSASSGSCLLFLNNCIKVFAKRYPNVEIEIELSDRKVDLVTSGIDAAIRSQALLEPDTYAIPVGPKVRMSVLASPAYLQEMGTPGTPSELKKHRCICYRLSNSQRMIEWEFSNTEGSYTILPKAQLCVNDLPSSLIFAEAGIGIVYIHTQLAQQHIESGKLIPILTEQTTSLNRYTINYLSKRHMPQRLKAFIQLVKDMSIDD